MNDRSIQAGGLGVDGTAAGNGGRQLDGQAGRGKARGQHHCACGRGRHLCHRRTDAREQNERMANCHGRLSRGSSEFGDSKSAQERTSTWYFLYTNMAAMPCCLAKQSSSIQHGRCVLLTSY